MALLAVLAAGASACAPPSVEMYGECCAHDYLCLNCNGVGDNRLRGVWHEVGGNSSFCACTQGWQGIDCQREHRVGGHLLCARICRPHFFPLSCSIPTPPPGSLPPPRCAKMGPATTCGIGPLERKLGE